jgi:hypothetical protein
MHQCPIQFNARSKRNIIEGLSIISNGRSELRDPREAHAPTAHRLATERGHKIRIRKKNAPSESSALVAPFKNHDIPRRGGIRYRRTSVSSGWKRNTTTTIGRKRNITTAMTDPSITRHEATVPSGINALTFRHYQIFTHTVGDTGYDTGLGAWVNYTRTIKKTRVTLERNHKLNPARKEIGGIYCSVAPFDSRDWES